MKTYFLNGSWNVVCDVCGFRFKSVDIVRRWDGAMTCRSCYEPRHPQDFIRVRDERVSVPFTRPEADVFVSINTVIHIKDEIELLESLNKVSQYVRRIPAIDDYFEPLIPLNRPLNTFALNGDALGGNGIPSGLSDETITVSDSISSRPNKPVSDATTLSENLVILSGKGINDNEVITETLTYSLPTQFVLDGDVLNNRTL